MNETARTSYLQAQAAIEAGAFAHAMELLRQARMMAGGDNDLAARILSAMVEIAPKAGCDAEAIVWRRQLARMDADGNALSAEIRSTTAPRARTRAHTALRWTVRSTVFLVALGVAVAALCWYWIYSASKYRPMAASAPVTTRSAPAAD